VYALSEPVALSPDGTSVGFSATRTLHTEMLDVPIEQLDADGFAVPDDRGRPAARPAGRHAAVPKHRGRTARMRASRA